MLINSCKRVIVAAFVLLLCSLALGKTSVAGGLLPHYYSQLNEYASFKENNNDNETNLVDVGDVDSVEIFSYVIQPGDTLSYISGKYDTCVETLVTLNNISDPHRVYPGEELEILTTPGLVHTVRAGETLDEIASSYYMCKDEIIRLSENRKKEVLREGERLVIPGDSIATLSRNSPGLHDMVPFFGWPLRGGTITSPFGWRDVDFHYGLDIAAPPGTPVFASADGTVTFNDYRGSYGLLVEIDHGREWVTRYAHNSKALVEAGQRVHEGDVIAEVGSTGYSTGPHVHFEIIYRNQRLNPEKHLP